jgi:hypothetical protein
MRRAEAAAADLEHLWRTFAARLRSCDASLLSHPLLRFPG